MRRLLTGILMVCACAGVPASAGAAAGDLPAGRTLVLVGQSGAAPGDELGAQTGTAPAGAMWYLGVHEDAAAVQAVLNDISRAVAERPGLVVDLGVSFGALSTPSPSYTAAIAAGAYDATLRRMAAWLRALPTVAYLRLGYEFDLLGGQYGPPALYAAAYRHIVDVLRAERVRNASYVWHSAGAFWRGADPSVLAAGSGTAARLVRDTLRPPASAGLPFEAFHPGAGYVDAFGISYWQDSCCFGRSGPQARAVYEERTREILTRARAMGLPLHVSEATPAYVGADSGATSVAWLDATFDLVEDFDIRALSLISIDWQAGGFFAAPFWNGYWPDSRFGRYAATCRRYVEALRSARYVGRHPGVPAALGRDGTPAPLPATVAPSGCRTGG